MKKLKEKKWIVITAVCLVAAIVAGVLLIPRINQEPVYVYGFQDGVAGMTDYYEGTGESSGMVTTDRIQPVYLTGTQTITDILVTEGQQVKKGDVLFTYDTTLSDIELQKKDISVQQAKLDLETAKQELAVINSYVPISYHPVEEVEPTVPEEPEKEISELDIEGKDYLAYSGQGTTTLTPKYVWMRSSAMLDNAMLDALFASHTSDSLYLVLQQTEGDAKDGAITDQFGVKVFRLTLSTVTDENGNVIQNGGNSYRIGLYDPSKVGQTGPVDDGVDMNSGYTAAEIHAMRLEKQAQIKELEFAIKMGEAEYRIMQKEADNGEVVAEFDGTVINLLDEETANMMGEPLLKVTGGGGYYVTGAVSELQLGDIYEGRKVDVMSWDTGMTYEGTIIEIQPCPTESDRYYYYGTSQNVSYYPYKIFIDESAQLQDGFYVSMTLQSREEESNLYINNAFVRTEGAASYVYVRGEDGRLEKRRIQVGGTLWGSYTKVTGGLTGEDYVAFPYGKNVKEGAPTMEGTDENLYGY